jgi:hypothetical protein
MESESNVRPHDQTDQSTPNGNGGNGDDDHESQRDSGDREQLEKQDTSVDGVLGDIREDSRHLGLFVKENWKGALKLFSKRCGIRFVWITYWISRFCMTFWILEAAGMLFALSINVIIQFIIGMFVPVAKMGGGINEDLVYASSFFFLVALLYPILSLLPTAFSLAQEIWSHQEMPATRLMCQYISKNLDKAMKYSNKEFDLVSKAIRCGKAGIIVFFAVISLAVAQSRVLELFFTIGLVVGLILWIAWVVLLLVVQFFAFRRGDVAFPTFALIVAIQYSKSETANAVNFVQIAKSSNQPLHVRLLLLIFSVHWLISILVTIFAMVELDAPGHTIFPSLLLLTFGLVYSYYNAFSSNNPQDNFCKEQFKKKLKCLGLLPATPNRVADSFMNAILTFIFLIVIMVIAGLFVKHAQDPRCDDVNIHLINISSSSLDRARRDIGSSSITYDICSQRWYGLTAVDMALLADVSYKDYNTKTSSGGCSTEVNQFLAKYFPQPKWDWKVVGYPEQGELVGFLDLYSEKLNLTVISVRGTRFSRWTDLMQDADLYTETATLQFFSLFIPITILLPQGTVAIIVYVSSFVERIFHAHPSSSYHGVLIDHIRLKREEYGDQIVITGHSLGGTLGKIAGATLGIRAFSFNSPGLLYSHKKFDLKQSNIDRTATNVVMQGDFVSKIDQLGGTIHRLSCPKSSLIDCHRLITTACELQEKCQFREGGRYISC